MRVTDRLRVEHGVYLVQLRHLEERVEAGAPPAELGAVVAAIAAAEAHHSRLEDTVLYPALARVVGGGFEPLEQITDDHRRLVEQVAAARSGRPEAVRAFVALLRAHLEREIHGLFVLAEEVITEDRLVSMASWQEQHVYEEMGRPAPWTRKGSPS